MFYHTHQSATRSSLKSTQEIRVAKHLVTLDQQHDVLTKSSLWDPSVDESLLSDYHWGALQAVDISETTED
eukprot:1087492-Rhodomonas_salina.1